MYLASVLDMAVLFYFFDDQLTNLSPNNCILLDVLFLVSLQPAQPAFAKAVRVMQESFEYHRPIFMDLRCLLRSWVRVENNGANHTKPVEPALTRKELCSACTHGWDSMGLQHTVWLTK
ncbi:hypothetical protein Tco_0595322 [Tanacetum coccineum]